MHRIHFKIKYPKLLLLLVTVLIAIILFNEGMNYAPFHDFLVSLGYFGNFLAGIFYAYGFTAAPATAVLLVLAKGQILFLSALIGGIGALLSDLLIFFFVRFSFADEIHKLEKEKIVKKIEEEERILFGHYYKYIFPALAGFLIASPLPTELGVTMMASEKELSVKRFMAIAYVLHTIGIFVILTIGSFI